MSTIRKEKYEKLLREARKDLLERLGESTWDFIDTLSWFEGGICFYLKEWDTSNDDVTFNFPYFVIGGLGLDDLLLEDGGQPAYACIYAKDIKKTGFDLKDFRKQLLDAGSQLLKDFPKKRDEDDTYPISYNLPEGRSGLSRLLLEDEPGFVKVLLEHGERLAELAPAITQILSKQK